MEHLFDDEFQELEVLDPDLLYLLGDIVQGQGLLVGLKIFSEQFLVYLRLSDLKATRLQELTAHFHLQFPFYQQELVQFCLD